MTVSPTLPAAPMMATPPPAALNAPANIAPPAAMPQGLPIAQAPQPPPDFIDIRGPIAPDFWSQYGTTVWVSALVAVVLAALAVWLWRRWLRGRTPPPSAAEIARLRIAAALGAFDGDDAAYSAALSQAVRAYIERALSLPAPERTTEEFLEEARGNPLLRGKPLERLGAFLAGCDLVKFARAPLDADGRADFANRALVFVDDTETALHPPAPEAAADKKEAAQ